MSATKISWETISEEFWGPYVNQILTIPTNEIRRVRPEETEAYRDIAALRFKGLVESNFLDPEKNRPEEMMLNRDSDSIILALYRRGTLRATLTLNTLTSRFPGTAAELEKQVRIDHPYFRSHELLEFTKLVIDTRTRGMRFAFQLVAASCIIAHALNKRHFWQVGRQDSRDISWREKSGFHFDDTWDFHDPSLNGMPSKLGYMDFRAAPDDDRVIWFLRRLYRKILELEF
jgi:hypothetical protein